MESRQHSHPTAEVDPRRIAEDPAYRTRYARVLLDRSGEATDHVELRRLARQVFPGLARNKSGAPLAQLIGSAATLRVAEREDGIAGDRVESSLIQKPDEPLDYPPRYADLDAVTRSRLIRFCEAQLADGREGRDALQNLDRHHGWPFSDRTFYVGPWKAARLRRRKLDDD